MQIAECMMEIQSSKISALTWEVKRCCHVISISDWGAICLFVAGRCTQSLDRVAFHACLPPLLIHSIPAKCAGEWLQISTAPLVTLSPWNKECCGRRFAFLRSQQTWTQCTGWLDLTLVGCALDFQPEFLGSASTVKHVGLVIVRDKIGAADTTLPYLPMEHRLVDVASEKSLCTAAAMHFFSSWLAELAGTVSRDLAGQTAGCSEWHSKLICCHWPPNT